MRKILSALLICGVLSGCFCGCTLSETNTTQESEISESSERAVRVSNAPLDEALIGTWQNGTSSFRFQKNRKVSLIIDFSSILYFKDDKSLVTAGTEFPADETSFDGKTLSVQHLYEESEEATDYMTLERTDNNTDKDNIDGEYKFLSGSYIGIVAGNLSIPEDKLELMATVKDGKFTITASDYCDYEVNSGLLEMFSENMNYVDNDATSVKYSYEVQGDTLLLTYEGGEPQKFTRID